MHNNVNMTIDDVIAECQTFYLAGQETTTILLTWTMVLLAMHQDWQDRARMEVLEVCGKNEYPNADAVNGLKIVRINTRNLTHILSFPMIVSNMFCGDR